MSTEHQQYSTHNQSDKIREYAEKRGIKIIKTYADEGKSGRSMGGRAALQQLFADVMSEHAEFNVMLVYDVSLQHHTLDGTAHPLHPTQLRAVRARSDR